MNTKKIKEQVEHAVEENPLAAVGVAAVFIGAVAKLIDALSSAQGRRAYARDVDRRVKKSKTR